MALAYRSNHSESSGMAWFLSVVCLQPLIGLVPFTASTELLLRTLSLMRTILELAFDDLCSGNMAHRTDKSCPDFPSTCLSNPL